MHYEVDEKKRTVAVTEEGVAKVEEILGIENLYDHVNVDMIHHLQAALKAKELYKRDVEYVVAARRGPDRRRAHRPHPSGPSLLGRSAPSDRGQRERPDQGREPDARNDHAAELLPHVREARRA